jgi:hypothetical protein
MIAAMILRRGLPVRSVHSRVEQVREAFRARRMRRGGVHEVLAALILVLKERGGSVPDWEIDRLQGILRSWKEDHPWLTGSDDYPMAALHATREESVEEVARRVEGIYTALRGAGFRRGNQLQLASHLLAVGPMEGGRAAGRFASIARSLREQRWRVVTSRYDEVAILTLCSEQPARLVRRVLGIQERLRRVKPRPGRDMAFSLAVGLVLSGETSKQEELAGTRDVAAARMAQAVLEAQQAAVIAAVAGATVATTAATAGS